MVWDRWDYIKEAEDKNNSARVLGIVLFTRNSIIANKKILFQLLDSSNKYIKKLNSSGYISYKEMKYILYICYEYRKACNLGKLYLLPKINSAIALSYPPRVRVRATVISFQLRFFMMSHQ